MPWVVGIDEAGYGPNLGPLVQAAVALRLPDDEPTGWRAFDRWVRRANQADDGRLLIDDSKKVYTGPNGFARLERTVNCFLAIHGSPSAETLPHWKSVLLHLHAGDRADVEAEHWFNPSQQLPFAGGPDDGHFGHWVDLVAHCGGIYFLRPRVVVAGRFNRTLDRAASKATVLSDGLIGLLQELPTVGRAAGIDYGHEPVLVVCDKQGGRNFYGPFLQDAFPDGWVVAERESTAESRYRVAGLGREVTVVFRPKADGDSVCVALASMVCKYLREVCMMQFNAFWQTHVPGLKPTAGYPVDAKRFYAEIRPAMERLGIHPDAVWRKK